MPPRISQYVFMILGIVFGVIALTPNPGPQPSGGTGYFMGAVLGHLVMAAISIYCLLRGWRAVQQARLLSKPTDEPPQP